MKIFLAVSFTVLLCTGLAVASSPAGPSNDGELVLAASSVSGTIESVDPRNLTLILKTDAGETQSLAITKKSVLRGVTQGDRVSCEMKDGKVTKIIKATPTPKDSPARQPTKGELGG